jgi:hypothetical protein
MVISIYSGSIRLIFLEVIVIVAYSGNWALVAMVIIPRFLLDFHLFLLEPIGMNNSCPSFFKCI